MTSAEHEVVFGAGVDGDFGLFPGQSQRLFTENVLRRGNSTPDLLGVKRMRRGKDDGLHTGVLEGFHFAAVVLEALGFGKFLPCWVRLRGANDLYIVLCLLQHGGHLLAPPAEANHRDFDGAGLIHLDLNLRCLPVANRDGVTADESANLCWAPSAVDASATTASHTAPSTAFGNLRTAASNFSCRGHSESRLRLRAPAPGAMA